MRYTYPFPGPRPARPPSLPPRSDRSPSIPAGTTPPPRTRSIGTFLGREALRLRNGSRDPAGRVVPGRHHRLRCRRDRASFVRLHPVPHHGGDGENEEIYLRPHKTNLPDAIQYAPVFRGQSAWQLYHGPGNTARTSRSRATSGSMCGWWCRASGRRTTSATPPGRCWWSRGWAARRGRAPSRCVPSPRRGRCP